MASLVQNTSLTPDDIGRLRVNQLEDLLEGFAKNNEQQEKARPKKKQLSDMDAIEFLMKNKNAL